MKTIEEKAKRYDEAIEALRSLFAEQAIKHCDRVNIKDITNIFSELKESKGEKTKRILHSISSKISFHLRDIFTEEEFQCFDAWSHAWLEKQGEQKPAAKYKVGDTIYYDSFGRLVSFVIANIVEDGTNNPIYEDKDGNSVFQNDIVEQNPTWSEEDEYTLGETIQHLEELIRIDKAKHCACDVQYYQRDIDWLKSLKERYTWKPSDEQMKALEHAINCYSCISPTNTEEVYTLEIMKEQLKKLREG